MAVKKQAFNRAATNLLCLALVLLSVSAACAGEIHLTAAVSLKEVLTDLSREYSAKHANLRFLNNFGGSGTLAKQIENGAPADLFISASSEWAQYLQKRQLLDPSSIRPFAYNSLVFVGTDSSRASGMHDLPKLEKIAMGSPTSVPAGEYALEAVKKAGLEKQLEKRLVFAKDVRECLMYAERGDVEGAFVYRSDALRGKRTRILFQVPEALHSRIGYPMALTAAGARNREAALFFAFLQGAEAKRVLAKYGFAVR